MNYKGEIKIDTEKCWRLYCPGEGICWEEEIRQYYINVIVNIALQFREGKTVRQEPLEKP